MGFRINLPELGNAVVRVDLRGLQRGVPQELLYFAHIGSAVQQVRCEGVTQHVRAFLSLYARLFQLVPHRPVNLRPGYAFSFVC